LSVPLPVASRDPGHIWYVSTSGDDNTGDGTQNYPFRTIQKGIDVSSDGDTVLMEKGRYLENINFLGKAILVSSQIIFDGMECTIESTIIDGNNVYSVVTFNSGEDSNSILRGLTVTRGYTGYGGGIRCYGSSPMIVENRVVQNTGNSGGSGIYCYGSAPKIRRNLVANNTGPAAIFLRDYSNAEIVNNTVCDNDWGGLSIQTYSAGYVKNNIFCNNAPYGIHATSSSSEILYNDVYGHDNNYEGISDQTGNNGNISNDPLFANPAAGDYYLTASSPCRDAGDPCDSVPPGGGDRIDMGAFEYLEPNFTMTVVPDSVMICAGDSTYFNVILTSWLGFGESVQLTCSKLPFRVTGFFDPDELVPTDSSLLMIYTDQNVAQRVYRIRITATGGGIVRKTTVLLDVRTYFGPVWHVSTSGHDIVGDGSEERPFRTIGRTIQAADDGDTVLVERGTYEENINFSGKSILVASHYIFDGLESTIESTIIDGNGTGSVVTFESGEDSNSVIRGFTISGGYAYYGGGIYCHASSPTIVENFVVENEGGPGGSGIFCYRSSAWIHRNLIANNSGPAAIFLLTDCNVHVVNNSVCDNSLGGISIQEGSNGYLKNNIIYENADYGIHVWSGSSWYVGYNDVYGQTNNYVGDISDQTGIEGNISADPLFVNPSAGDYHLTPGSPCIDAGDPPGVDMGAFEYFPKAILVNKLKPELFSLSQNYPNPFNLQTQIRYALPADCDVKFTIYDILGRRVRVLVDEHQSAGYRNVHWDGKEERGIEVASGIYFYKIEAGQFVQTKKMLLIK
jgi:hypothetical protein